MNIREETPADYPAIRDVNCLAFQSEEEADLVDRLRARGEVVASLVAELDDRIAGHVMFSDLSIETSDRIIRAVALAPLAVRPADQRRGIGEMLVREGLRVCRARGHAVAIVLGHPDYYPRFGFSAKLAETLQAPFSGDAFMALELAPGALKGVAGRVRYASAFGL